MKRLSKVPCPRERGRGGLNGSNVLPLFFFLARELDSRQDHKCLEETGHVQYK